MNPTYDFDGQVALVTGAGGGMGLDTARAFAGAGAAVALADVDGGAVRAAADDLTAAGHQALGVTCDVADEAQVAALVDETVETFGRLDMAFNNAGIMLPVADAADEPAEEFDRVTAINMRGVWACMKHELRHMRAQGSGRSSTAPRSAASSATPVEPPTTPPSTASSGLPRAPRSTTRHGGSASTPYAPARSRPRWSPT